MKTNFFLLVTACSMCGQLLTGCVSFRKYPSSWPQINNVTTASQLSGVYHPELLQILTEFMEVPVVRDTGSINVQLLRFFDQGIDRRPGMKSKEGCPICDETFYWGRGDMEPFIDQTN